MKVHKKILLSVNNPEIVNILKKLLEPEFEISVSDNNTSDSADIIISDNSSFVLPDPDINSVTGLPGLNTIISSLKKMLFENKSHTVIACNINHFKQYNAAQGYEQANALLKFLADLVKNGIIKSGSSKNFIGHAYNDFFISIIDSDKAVTVSDYIITRFDEHISEQGNTSTNSNSDSFMNREGDIKQLPKTSIRLAGVDINKYEPEQYLLVLNTIDALLQRAKLEEYSCIFFDRRTKP